MLCLRWKHLEMYSVIQLHLRDASIAFIGAQGFLARLKRNLTERGSVLCCKTSVALALDLCINISKAFLPQVPKERIN